MQWRIAVAGAHLFLPDQGRLGIEPRHRSLEELKGDEPAPALVKQVT